MKTESHSDESNDSEQKEKRPRNRSSNFTPEEELMLALEVEKYKNIIECKLTDKMTNTEKNEAWNKIELAFNSKSKTMRSTQQIRFKYDNLKMKARKISAGDSSITTNTTDPVMEVVLRIINKSADDNSIIEYGTIHRPLMINNIDEDVDMDENATWDDDEIEIKDTQISMIVNNSFTDNSEKLIIERDSFRLSEDNNDSSINVISVEKCAASTSLKKNWSTLEYPKPKPPISKKMRHSTRRPVMDDYYKKKIELINEEIKKSVLEQEEILIKRRRSEEEHEKKMKIMDLDIKLKQELLSEQES